MTKTNKLKQVPPDKGFYIAGFVDGEGSFFLSTRPRADYPTGWKFSPTFSVGNSDLVVLEICKQYLGCGKIREVRQNFYVLEVADRRVLEEFIIPFFTRFGFLSNKKKHEFRVFQTILTKVDQGIHTTADLNEILALRKELGKFRQDRLTHDDEKIRKSFKSK